MKTEHATEHAALPHRHEGSDQERCRDCGGPRSDARHAAFEAGQLSPERAHLGGLPRELGS